MENLFPLVRTISAKGWNLAVDDGDFHVIKKYKTEDQALEALEAVQNKILDALEVGDEYVLISWDDSLLKIKEKKEYRLAD